MLLMRYNYGLAKTPLRRYKSIKILKAIDLGKMIENDIYLKFLYRETT